MRVLEQLRNTCLGAPYHCLQIGFVEFAFADGVLLIEQGELTVVASRIARSNARVELRDDSVLVDLWSQHASSIRIKATDKEIQAAESYFLAHGFNVRNRRSSVP